jgi:signal transduction histidine kinase
MNLPRLGAMSERAARRLAWSACLLWAFLFLTSIAFDLASGTNGDVLFGLSTTAFPVAAILILARQPRNRIGWILMAIGLGWAAGTPESYGAFAISRGLPGGALAIAVASPMWAPPIGLMGTVLLLRFPDGNLLSPRWRKVEVLAAVAISVTTLVILVAPGDLGDSGYPNLANPLGIEALRPFFGFVIPFLLLIPVTILASAIGLVMRFRRSRGTERLQLKWLATAGAIVAVTYLLAMVFSIDTAWLGDTTPTWVWVLQTASVSSFLLIPVAIGFAVLRYRLYDIDLVINKAVVYGALAAFITAVYVAIVVGIGSAVGTHGNPNVGLSIVATAVVAFAFQPVRERVQRLANRLVYGRRATPYEVLSGFAERFGGTYATDDIGPAMARLLVEGTGARRAEVWLQTDRELRLEASWPAADAGTPVTASPGSMPPAGEFDRAFPVVHGGRPLGFLVIGKSAADPVGPADEKLVTDVAGQAGLILRNIRLIEDLKASRRRLVAARDEERRKLERDIHDGAQQRLVALSVLYNLAGRLVGPEAVEQRAALADLNEQAQAALETLRDLARGIYPPLLADQGLLAALEAQARKAPLPVTVLAAGVGRYPQEAEAAVYFCCLEALQNVGKHAEARHALVRLQEVEGELRFEVKDDGVGFDLASTPRGSGTTNMTDRLAAIGGSLEVRSRPGSGTTMAGRVQVRVREAIPA